MAPVKLVRISRRKAQGNIASSGLLAPLLTPLLAETLDRIVTANIPLILEQFMQSTFGQSSLPEPLPVLLKQFLQPGHIRAPNCGMGWVSRLY